MYSKETRIMLRALEGHCQFTLVYRLNVCTRVINHHLSASAASMCVDGRTQDDYASKARFQRDRYLGPGGVGETSVSCLCRFDSMQKKTIEEPRAEHACLQVSMQTFASCHATLDTRCMVGMTDDFSKKLRACVCDMSESGSRGHRGMIPIKRTRSHWSINCRVHLQHCFDVHRLFLTFTPTFSTTGSTSSQRNGPRNHPPHWFHARRPRGRCSCADNRDSLAPAFATDYQFVSAAESRR